VPSWDQVLREIEGSKVDGPIDAVRRKYLKQLSEYTKRATIAYYSGWLSYPTIGTVFVINDEDKNAFMTAVHKLDRSTGLDLILHTPGGDLAAAESLVHYLRQMFGTNMRAIIPQLAMSAGTMMACACRSIVMGHESSLGPIDPQMGGIPARGVISEFETAIRRIKDDPAEIPMWQAIIGQYHPSFLGSCQKSIDWANRVVTEWLATGMFEQEKDAKKHARNAVDYLADPDETLNHARHIHPDECEKIGLRIERLELDRQLQDLVLTVHHAYMHTFSMTKAMKIVENDMGVAVVRIDSSKRNA